MSEPSPQEAPGTVEAGPDAEVSWTPRPSIKDELRAARSGKTTHSSPVIVEAELKSRAGVVEAAPPDQPSESVQLVPDEAELEQYAATRPDLQLATPTTDEQAHANARLLRELRDGDQARIELEETRTDQATYAAYSALEEWDPDQIQEAATNLLATVGPESQLMRDFIEEWNSYDPEGVNDWAQGVVGQLHQAQIAANNAQIAATQAEIE